MVFTGFSLYNKKSCIVDTDRKPLPGGQVFCDGRTTLFYEKGKETMIVEPLVWRLSHRTIGEPGILEKTEICTKDRLERFPES